MVTNLLIAVHRRSHSRWSTTRPDYEDVLRTTMKLGLALLLNRTALRWMSRDDEAVGRNRERILKLFGIPHPDCPPAAAPSAEDDHASS
jgi:hypothetical protein